MSGQTEAMECLIKHGADTNAVSYTLKLTRKWCLSFNEVYLFTFLIVALAVLLATKRPQSLYNRYVKTYTTLHDTPMVTSSTSIGITGYAH